MKFDITIIQPDRTDLEPLVFKATPLKLLLLVAFVVLLPILGFWISYSYIAPAKINANISELKRITEEAKFTAKKLTAQHDAIVKENENLKMELQQERQERAELEAKMTITENARSTASDTMAENERELISLRRKVAFYTQLMKPAGKKSPFQCFNVTAKLNKGKLVYGVTFMKNNRKNKDKVKMSVAFRILAGANANQLKPEEIMASAPLQERSLAIITDYRLTGSFKTKNLPEGLRLLDIKAYNSNNKIIASCWKAF